MPDDAANKTLATRWRSWTCARLILGVTIRGGEIAVLKADGDAFWRFTNEIVSNMAHNTKKRNYESKWATNFFSVAAFLLPTCADKHPIFLEYCLQTHLLPSIQFEYQHKGPYVRLSSEWWCSNWLRSTKNGKKHINNHDVTMRWY